MNELTNSFVALIILIVIAFFVGYYAGVIDTKIKIIKEDKNEQKRNLH